MCKMCMYVSLSLFHICFRNVLLKGVASAEAELRSEAQLLTTNLSESSLSLNTISINVCVVFH